MSHNTPNYNLIKPDQLDFYDVDDFNANADIIDTELKNLSESIRNINPDVPDATQTAKGKARFATPVEAAELTSIDTIVAPGTIPIASLTQRGLIQTATGTEADALTNTTKAVTPGTIPKAGESQQGVIQTATQAEVNAGTVNNKAVVPSNAKPSNTNKGLIATASDAEMLAGTAADKAVVPSGLKNMINVANGIAGVDPSGNRLANELITPRTIDGVQFKGSADIHHQTTNTQAGNVSAKTTDTITGFVRAIGARVTVKFSNDNTATDPTLSVSGTTAANIRYAGANILPGMIVANIAHSFEFDGTYWRLLNPAVLNSAGNPAAYLSGGSKKLIAEFTASGTFTLSTYGLAIGQKIDAYIVGGGASGSTIYGGCGGYCKLVRDIVLNSSSYSIVVGSGGNASNTTTSNPGGNSSAFGTTVEGGQNDRGGSGGGASASSYGGGRGGDFGRDGYFGAATSVATGAQFGLSGGGTVDFDPLNPYDGILYGCGGGCGTGGGVGGGNGSRTASGRGGGGMNGVAGAVGGGGGGTSGHTGSPGTSTAGGSGIVLIYA